MHAVLLSPLPPSSSSSRLYNPSLLFYTSSSLLFGGFFVYNLCVNINLFSKPTPERHLFLKVTMAAAAAANNDDDDDDDDDDDVLSLCLSLSLSLCLFVSLSLSLSLPPFVCHFFVFFFFCFDFDICCVLTCKGVFQTMKGAYLFCKLERTLLGWDDVLEASLSYWFYADGLCARAHAIATALLFIYYHIYQKARTRSPGAGPHPRYE